LNGTLLTDEPLARYTSWRVGGCADKLYKPSHTDDLAVFLKSLGVDVDVTWLGLGSNVLVRDGGVEGAVVVTQSMAGKVSLVDERIVRADAGVTCAKLARFAVDNGLSGLEFLVGVPGTVGGALAMNAGAYGSEAWDFVSQVECMGRSGEVVVRSPSEFKTGYRSVVGPVDEWFVAGFFELAEGVPGEGQARLKSLLKQRSDSQPIGQFSGGSVFRNPPGDFESCGLKGFCVGDAQVSPKHANFIINRGKASAADIEDLIVHLQKVVAERCGVHLVPEVKVIGVKSRKQLN